MLRETPEGHPSVALTPEFMGLFWPSPTVVGRGSRSDEQMFSGSFTIKAFLDLDAIDRLEFQAVPVFMGWGMQLFSPGAFVG